MSNGIVAFIAGVLAVLLAWLGGRVSKSKDQKLKTEQAKLKQEQNVSQILGEVNKATAQTAQSMGQTQAEHDEVMRQIDKARKTNDMDAIARIAQNMAERALNRGASQR